MKLFLKAYENIFDNKIYKYLIEYLLDDNNKFFES